MLLRKVLEANDVQDSVDEARALLHFVFRETQLRYAPRGWRPKPRGINYETQIDKF